MDQEASPTPTPLCEMWLTRKEVAKRWKMPPATLAQWGSQGRGPRYGVFGRHVRYRLSDLIVWENAQFKDRGEQLALIDLPESQQPDGEDPPRATA